ncbi:MAG: hypothetical protein NTZ93_01320 [Candidatus Beckwithbacteria bacterium]|nr:hypothetical protein [Candidatus Beckwithbacteria bacterium]
MEIELIKKEIKKVRDRQRLKKLAGKILVLILFGLSGIMIFVSLFNLSISAINKKLELQLNVIKQKITDLKEVETKQVYLLSKLQSFKDLLKLQERHQAVAEAVFALVPDGTSLKGFDVNESGIIKLAGDVADWETFNLLLGHIREAKAGKLIIVNAQVDKISFDSKSGINFDINLQLSGGNVN